MPRISYSKYLYRLTPRQPSNSVGQRPSSGAAGRFVPGKQVDVLESDVMAGQLRAAAEADPVSRAGQGAREVGEGHIGHFHLAGPGECAIVSVVLVD